MRTKNIIALEITSACASECVKCYRRKIWGRGAPMSDDLFDNVMDGLYKYNQDCSILLGTGEPILEAAKVFRLIEWSNKTNNSIHILTTGIPLIPKNIEILARAKNLTTQVTLDGFTEKDVENVQRIKLLKVKENISQAATKIKLIINYTLTNKNHQSLGDVITFAKKNRIRHIYVTPMMVYELCTDAKEFIPDLDSPLLLSSLEKAKKLAADLDVKLSVGMGRAHPLTDADELHNHCEKVGLLRPIVRIDGKVSVCWGREDVILGDLCLDKLEKLLTSDLLAAIRQKHATGELSKFCDDCIVFKNSTLSTMQIPRREPIISIHSMNVM